LSNFYFACFSHGYTPLKDKHKGLHESNNAIILLFKLH